jgi:hypothetical protein
VKATGNQWALNTRQLHLLPVNSPVALTPHTASGSLTGPQPPVSLTSANTQIVSNTVYTCTPGSQEMGCLEISFMRAIPAHVAILGAISSNPVGQFQEAGFNTSGYWLCKGSTANNINRMCPSKGLTSVTDLLYKGALGCGEEIITLAQLLTQLKEGNQAKLWLLRLAGFILFWLSINMCCQPIKSMLGFITNMMDASTDCIPCVGGCVDTLTDIFMGVSRQFCV